MTGPLLTLLNAPTPAGDGRAGLHATRAGTRRSPLTRASWVSSRTFARAAKHRTPPVILPIASFILDPPPRVRALPDGKCAGISMLIMVSCGKKTTIGLGTAAGESTWAFVHFRP
jgi:hypothetical protein